MTREAGSDSGHDRPQLQMWDEEREFAVGTLAEDGREWAILVVVDAVASDLVRGRLSFRSEEERFDTAAVLVEETSDGVVRRAGELPESMLRQLLSSARE